MVYLLKMKIFHSYVSHDQMGFSDTPIYSSWVCVPSDGTRNGPCFFRRWGFAQFGTGPFEFARCMGVPRQFRRWMLRGCCRNHNESRRIDFLDEMRCDSMEFQRREQKRRYVSYIIRLIDRCFFIHITYCHILSCIFIVRVCSCQCTSLNEMLQGANKSPYMFFLCGCQKFLQLQVRHGQAVRAVCSVIFGTEHDCID